MMLYISVKRIKFCISTLADSIFSAYESCLDVVAVKKKIKDFEMNFEKEHGHKVLYCTLASISPAVLLL